MRRPSSAPNRMFRLDRKMTAYTLAGTAALVGSQAAKADSVTYYSNVDVTETSTTDVPAQSGYVFPLANGIYLGITSSYEGDFIEASDSSVQFLINGSLPANLMAGALIGPGSSFASIGKLAGDNVGNFSQTGGTGYVGFDFAGALGTQYGWAQLATVYDYYNDGSAADDGQYSTELLSYAIDNNAGTSIAAGQTVAATPEPATLSLVALGAAGVEALRRRRKGTAAQG